MVTATTQREMYFTLSWILFYGGCGAVNIGNRTRQTSGVQPSYIPGLKRVIFLPAQRLRFNLLLF